MLRLYETGLPAWALFLPRYGFYYRPWLRTLARGLFVLVSVLSMMAGFYDLYKHVPGLDAVFTRFWKPLGDFLERHAAARLSILASYLFTQSRMFGPVLAQLSATARPARSVAAAAWAPFGGVLGPYSTRLRRPRSVVRSRRISHGWLRAPRERRRSGWAYGAREESSRAGVGSGASSSSVAMGGFGVGWIASAVGNGARR